MTVHPSIVPVPVDVVTESAWHAKTRRDELAKTAMIELIRVGPLNATTTPDGLAATAYQIAEAMMRESRRADWGGT